MYECEAQPPAAYRDVSSHLRSERSSIADPLPRGVRDVAVENKMICAMEEKTIRVKLTATQGFGLQDEAGLRCNGGALRKRDLEKVSSHIGIIEG